MLPKPVRFAVMGLLDDSQVPLAGLGHSGRDAAAPKRERWRRSFKKRRFYMIANTGGAAGVWAVVQTPADLVIVPVQADEMRSRLRRG